MRGYVVLNSWHKLLIWASFSSVLTISIIVLMSSRVSAAPKVEYVFENGSTYPQFVIDRLNNYCSTPQASAQTTWLSLAGNPSAVSTSITRNANIQLQYNVVTKRCSPSQDTAIAFDYFRPTAGYYDIGSGNVNIPIFNPSPPDDSDLVTLPPDIGAAGALQYSRGSWVFAIGTSSVPVSQNSGSVAVTVSSRQFTVRKNGIVPQILCIESIPQDAISGLPEINRCNIATDQIWFDFTISNPKNFDVYPDTPLINTSGGTVTFDAENRGDGVSRFTGDLGVAINTTVWVNGAVRSNQNNFAHARAVMAANNGRWSTARGGAYVYSLGALNPGDVVCAEIRVNPSQGETDGALNDSPRSAGGLNVTCETYVIRPYFRSYGGDVVVGRTFANGSTCSPADTNSTIKAFVRQDGSGWKGSGSEFAARATGVIENFLSASTRTSAPTSPNGLSFGNRNASTNSFSPAPGTDKTAYTGCIPDYWSEYIEGKYPTPEEVDAHNLALDDNETGTQASASGEWAGAVIGVGNSGYYFYDGDLTITGNVTLAGYNFDADDPSADLSQIPKFILVVRGNINIAPNVTRLDGVYIAQENPDPSVTTPTGIINTCARTGVTWQQCVPAPKLEVQGSFIAREIKLNRLRGDVDDAGVREGSGAPQAAEVFIFRPDLLLSTAGDSQNPSTKITDYDSIVGLPPVL